MFAYIHILMHIMHSFIKILYLEIIVEELINKKIFLFPFHFIYIKYSSIAIATFYGKVQREFTLKHTITSLSIHDLRIKI